MKMFICLNSKCFDFKLIMHILILIVLNLDQLDLGTSPSIKYRSQPTELHRLARLAGRAIEDALKSATTDVLMKCCPKLRANGVD